MVYNVEDYSIHESRLNQIMSILKLSGINESKIKRRESNAIRGASEKLYNEKDGVLIIVQ